MRRLPQLRPTRLVAGAVVLAAAVVTATSALLIDAKPAGPATAAATPAAHGSTAPGGDVSSAPETASGASSPSETATNTSAGTGLSGPPAGSQAGSQASSQTAGQAPTAAPPSASAPPPPTRAPTPTPTSQPPPPPPAPAGYVYRCGTQLCLDGRVWSFAGLNAYEAATEWGTNAGCGTELSNSQLNSLFASLGPGHVVRFWAFQALAINYTTKQLDWTPIDRVINAAAAHGDKVIPALSGESGGCDDNHWKDAAWFSGGYMNVYDSGQWPASTPLSYWNYMQDFLDRYRNNSTIAMIELVSEPSPTASGYVCVNESQAARSLRSFFDVVGGKAKSIDPHHLIESGMQGAGQCGAQGPGGSDYGYVMASPGVDVASVHDYTTQAIPTVSGTDLPDSLRQAHDDGKPLIVGEAGEDAQSNLSGCASLSSRAGLMTQKMNAQFSDGINGFVAWDWVPSNPGNGSCSYDVGPGDPLIAELANR